MSTQAMFENPRGSPNVEYIEDIVSTHCSGSVNSIGISSVQNSNTLILSFPTDMVSVCVFGTIILIYTWKSTAAFQDNTVFLQKWIWQTPDFLIQ